jgi:hypothetical protein
MAMMVPRLRGKFGIVSQVGSGIIVGLFVNCHIVIIVHGPVRHEGIPRVDWQQGS